MRSADTNILVRYLTGDDAAQFALARQFFAKERVFVGITVTLETEWVLRQSYNYAPARVAAALRALMGLATVRAEDEACVAAALDAVDAGLEFADALHLARSRDCTDLVTFDRRLARRATGREGVPVTLLGSDA